MADPLPPPQPSPLRQWLAEQDPFILACLAIIALAVVVVIGFVIWLDRSE